MSLVEDYSTAYREASAKWEPWWKAAKGRLEFKLGKQWSDKEKAYLKAQDRDPEVYNRVRRIVHLISGFQRKNRLAIRVESTTGSDQTAQLLSGIVQYQMTLESAYVLMSKAFENGALTCGINWVEPYMDYSTDPVNGNIKFARIPYNGLVMDPNWSELDMNDCRYALRRKWVSRDEAKLLVPGHSKQINRMQPKGSDGKFPYASNQKDFRGKPLLRLDQFYRQDTKKVYQLVNTLNGKITPWEGNSTELDKALSQDSPLGVKWGQILKRMTSYKKIVKVAYLLDDTEIYDGDDPLGLEDYPFVPVVGYFDSEYDSMKWKLNSPVGTIMDPQRQSNKRRMKMIDMLDSQLLGLGVEEDAFVNRANANLRGAGVTYWLKKGGLGKISPITGPNIPPGTLESLKLMDSDPDELLGISGEISGLIESGQAAENFILAKLREGNSLSGFQPLFDSYRDSKKLLGTKIVRLSQLHYKPEKVMRITKKQPTKEFYDKTFGLYDCTVSEGALTDSQKKMRYGESLALKAQGIPIPASKILEYSGLEIEPEIIAGIKKQEEMQQQLTMAKVQGEIMAEQIAMALNKAKAEAVQSKSGLDRAKTMELIVKLQGQTPEQQIKLLEMAMQIEEKGHFGVDPMNPQPGQQNNVIPLRQQMSSKELMTTR